MKQLVRPIRILGFKNNPQATLDRNLILLIDNQPLVDLLEDSIPKNANIREWREKRDVRVIVSSLRKSITSPGEYDFLTCAHCAIPEDILISPVQVIHQGEYFIWKMKPPGADFYFDDYELLEFKFHKPQYQKSINQIIS